MTATDEQQGQHVVGNVMLVSDRPVAPTVVRAYRGRVIVAYAILDLFGWAIVAPTLNDLGRRELSTVDRYAPAWPGEAKTYELLPHAIEGLFRYATTGTTGDQAWDRYPAVADA